MIPSPTDSSRQAAYRRRTLYVDSAVQRSLLVAMVAMEIVLVAAAIGFAYWRLSQLIDANMYRMSFSPGGPSLMAQFSKEGFWVLGAFAVINMIALMIAAKIWTRHERRTLQDLAGLIDKTSALDFSGDDEARRQREVLALAAAWRAQERSRFTAIRDQVTKLEASLSSSASDQELLMALEKINGLLSRA